MVVWPPGNTFVSLPSAGPERSVRQSDLQRPQVRRSTYIRKLILLQLDRFTRISWGIPGWSIVAKVSRCSNIVALTEMGYNPLDPHKNEGSGSCFPFSARRASPQTACGVTGSRYMSSETIESKTTARSDPAPSMRTMGSWTLTAVGLNMVVGAGFFLLPAEFFRVAGAWGPWVIAVVGVFMIPIALSFAEVGSRFEGHGGPYLYLRAAFGRLAGFEIAWILWVSRVVSHASVLAGLLILLQVILGVPLTSAWQATVVLGLTAVVAAFSIAGRVANAGLITTFAVLKVLAVVILITAGVPKLEAARFIPDHSLSLQDIGAAALLALFSIAGFENLAIPAGEATNPQRDVPRALFLALGAGLALLIAANLIAIGLVDDLGNSKLALADAGRAALGQPGWVMLAGAAILAVVGHNAGSILACSRLLQGLVDMRDIPPWLGKRTARLGRPVTAVLINAIVISVLALSSSFVWLIGLAIGSRVLVYAGVAIATSRLRSSRFTNSVPAPKYKAPVPRLVLLLSLLGSCFILFFITTAQLWALVIGLLTGLVLFGLNWKLAPSR